VASGESTVVSLGILDGGFAMASDGRAVLAFERAVARDVAIAIGNSVELIVGIAAAVALATPVTLSSGFA